MKLGTVITLVDQETVFNALRLARYSLEQEDEVRIFVSGKGVEVARIEDPSFDVKGRALRSSACSGQPVSIQNFGQPEAWFTSPTRHIMPASTGTMHIILAVTDHGTPRLTPYQWETMEVKP